MVEPKSHPLLVSCRVHIPLPKLIMPSLSSMSVKNFKTAVGADVIKFLRNPATGKLFAAADNGSTYKVEQEIDPKRPIVVLLESGDTTTACFINERENIVAEFSL